MSEKSAYEHVYTGDQDIVYDQANRPDKPGLIGLIGTPQDVVNYPSHYTFSEYEPIKVIRAWGLSFALGNVVKYVARAGRKDPLRRIEDLKKARAYLNDEILSWENDRNS